MSRRLHDRHRRRIGGDTLLYVILGVAILALVAIETWWQLA